MDRDALGFDFLVRSGDSEQLSCVHSPTHDVADDQVAPRDLHPDLVAGPRSRGTKALCPLLNSLTVEADVRMQRIVRDEILSDALVKDAPVARLILVDRLQVREGGSDALAMWRLLGARGRWPQLSVPMACKRNRWSGRCSDAFHHPKPRPGTRECRLRLIARRWATGPSSWREARRTRVEQRCQLGDERESS
jgi:hypothetical protein